MRKISFFTAALLTVATVGSQSMTTNAAPSFPQLNNNCYMNSNNNRILLYGPDCGTSALPDQVQDCLQDFFSNYSCPQAESDLFRFKLPQNALPENKTPENKVPADTAPDSESITTKEPVACKDCEKEPAQNELPIEKGTLPEKNKEIGDHSTTTVCPENNCNTQNTKPINKNNNANKRNNANTNENNKPNEANNANTNETNKPNENNNANTNETNKPNENNNTNTNEANKPNENNNANKDNKNDISNPTQNLSYAEQVVNLVNEERAKIGLNALTIDSNLQNAAQIRATEIEISFSHTRPNGTSFATAIREQGISYRTAGENIAYGQRSPEEVVEAWMNSEGHRANILNANFNKIGVGYYQNNRGVKYWSQEFTN